MGLQNISIVLLLKYLILFDKGFAEDVRTAFERAGIVPNILPVGPEMKLTVTYLSGVSVEFGNEVTPAQAQNEPVVSWPSEANDNALYTIVAFDADAISADLPIVSDFIQWIVGNIPGQQIQMGDTIAQYSGPAPPPPTGFHRIIFVVYRQPSKLVFDELSLLDGFIFIRLRFSVTGFQAKYNLTGPIAGNFFRSKFDGLGTVINIVDGIGG